MRYFQVSVDHYVGERFLRTEAQGEFATLKAAETVRGALEDYYRTLFRHPEVDVRITAVAVTPGVPKVYCFQCRYDAYSGDTEPILRIMPTLTPPSREALGLREGLEVAYGSTAAEARANAQRDYFANAECPLAA